MAQPHLKIVDRHLFEIGDDFRELQVMLEDSDIDPSTLADTLEAIETEFDIKAQQVAIVIANISAPLEAIKAQISRLEGKEKSIKNKVDSLKAYLRTNMEKLNKKKVEGDVFNITLAKGRDSVIVADVDDLADEYVKVKTTTTADKVAIKKALDSGVEVFGASIQKGQSSIQIR